MNRQPASTERVTYLPIIPEITNWPIYRLSKERKGFTNKVIESTVANLVSENSENGLLNDLIANAIYLERIRIKTAPFGVDPKDQSAFWNNVRKRLLDAGPDESGKGKRHSEIQILNDIITRYVNEIAGKFDPGTYRLASRLIPIGFAKLLNARLNYKKKRRNDKHLPASIHQKIKLIGPIETIRKVAAKGTIVMLPTHSSNMDSLIMGWAIRAMGLPAFHYGAGLNLFNIRLLAYFMNRLGAYKVDRRKKNKIYLETLKNYSTQAIRKGAHSVFFPGGGRARSGRLEDRLKLGLLGTSVEAQRLNFEIDGSEAQKIFIVPAIINYHFVVEAPALIEDWLKKTGKERYIHKKDKLSTSYKILKFFLKFLFASSDMAISFGRPMDIFGNYVDDEGTSYDSNGHKLDISKYFYQEGNLSKDSQRDSEYTRMLGKKVTSEFKKNNMAFSSHVLAYTAFKMIQHAYKKLDVYQILRLPEDEIEINYKTFSQNVSSILEALKSLEEKQKIIRADHLDHDLESIIAHGLKNVGLYNAKRPLLKNKAGNITTKSLKSLFYYHNRLDGYELGKYVS